MQSDTFTLPRAFLWRRLHSLLGLWLVLFLVEHLLTNSQAALVIGEDGSGFIRAVNLIKDLPYLHVVEIVLLGIPILLHGILGVRYLLSSKINAFPGSKRFPRLTRYPRNRAYTWQRITSWILVVGIIAHIGFMRFYMYPQEVRQGEKESYFVRIQFDPGLYTVAERLGVQLYNRETVLTYQREKGEQEKKLDHVAKEIEGLRKGGNLDQYHKQKQPSFQKYQQMQNEEIWLQGVTKKIPTTDQVIAEASSFGTATLLVVRDAFKSIWTSIFYTIFVLAAVFHAFNGLWTFMITWGIVLKMRSQSSAVNFCVGVMALVGFLGLAAIWGTYFLNLRQ